MRYCIILLLPLLILTGCRDDKAAARAAKAAEESRIEKEVAKRVSTERQALAERKPLLQTIRVVGFIVLTCGAVTGLVWLRKPWGLNPVRPHISTQQALPPQTYDHYPVNPGRVLDLQQVSPPTRHRRRRRNRAPASRA